MKCTDLSIHDTGAPLIFAHFEVELLMRLGAPRRTKWDFNSTTWSLFPLNKLDIRKSLQLSQPTKLEDGGYCGHTLRCSPSESPIYVTPSSRPVCCFQQIKYSKSERTVTRLISWYSIRLYLSRIKRYSSGGGEVHCHVVRGPCDKEFHGVSWDWEWLAAGCSRQEMEPQFYKCKN